MKKAMRKSALLSSVAMLIVSAIVLTSATYAWFSASDQANVQTLDSKVTASSGLLISVDNGLNWGTDFTINNVPDPFIPVSTEDGSKWITGEYDLKNKVLTVSDAKAGSDGGQYVTFPLWVTGPVNEDVNVTIDFGSTAAQTKMCLKFALVKEGSTLTKAVAATPNSDNKFMGVTEIGDATGTSGAFTTNKGTEIDEITDADLTFNLGSATRSAPVKYTAYLWLEGNDADCDAELFTGTQGIQFSMNFKLASAA